MTVAVPECIELGCAVGTAALADAVATVESDRAPLDAVLVVPHGSGACGLATRSLSSRCGALAVLGGALVWHERASLSPSEPADRTRG
jgi:hypothetical protein